MKAELTRNIIDKHVPKTLFKGEHENFELQHVYAELDRIEEIADKWSEKETPSTVVITEVFDYFLNESNEQYRCPKCDLCVFPDDNYCSHCGQKLDWSEK